jgi:hypothetical protein
MVKLYWRGKTEVRGKKILALLFFSDKNSRQNVNKSYVGSWTGFFFFRNTIQQLIIHTDTHRARYWCIDMSEIFFNNVCSNWYNCHSRWNFLYTVEQNDLQLRSALSTRKTKDKGHMHFFALVWIFPSPVIINSGCKKLQNVHIL